MVVKIIRPDVVKATAFSISLQHLSKASFLRCFGKTKILRKQDLIRLFWRRKRECNSFLSILIMIDLQVPEIIVHRLVHLSINLLKELSLPKIYKNSNDKSIQNE
jgi:hypothetical protein